MHKVELLFIKTHSILWLHFKKGQMSALPLHPSHTCFFHGLWLVTSHLEFLKTVLESPDFYCPELEKQLANFFTI